MATERWFTLVEFTFDVETDPSKARHIGDEQIDFARRAFEEGLRPRLANAFPGNDGINWTVIPQEVGDIVGRQQRETHFAKRES